MFTNVGWGEILVLLVVAVVILGPERLPDAAKWLGQGLRKVRDWANDAQDQFKEGVDSEFGDLKDFQKPVKELAKIRTMGPKAAAVHYLLDDDDSLLDIDLGIDDLKKDLSFSMDDLTAANEADEHASAVLDDASYVAEEASNDAYTGATTHGNNPLPTPTTEGGQGSYDPAEALRTDQGLVNYAAARSAHNPAAGDGQNSPHTGMNVNYPHSGYHVPESGAEFSAGMTPAPDAPLTVGDSWGEADAEDVDITFDDDV